MVPMPGPSRDRRGPFTPPPAPPGSRSTVRARAGLLSKVSSVLPTISRIVTLTEGGYNHCIYTGNDSSPCIAYAKP